MSVRSMTGFASAPVETDSVKGSVTVRSLNHRYLDLSVHLPRRLQGLEPELRAALQGRLHSGKVEVSVRAALRDEKAEVMVAPRPVIAGIVRGLREIQAEHGLEGGVSVADVARFPGAVEVLDGDTAVAEAATRDIVASLQQALAGLDGMRRAEGGHMESDLRRGLDAVEAAAERIEALSAAGQAERRAALLAKGKELCAELGLEDGKLYQEVVRLVDRHDVAEELQRLRSHVAQARGLLAIDAPSGKRLDFLAQELAREANTLGSKAVSAAMVQEVVALKSEIERVREQVQNVE
jgi:uncharacterized protein (TIGR00255 family)